MQDKTITQIFAVENQKINFYFVSHKKDENKTEQKYFRKKNKPITTFKSERCISIQRHNFKKSYVQINIIFLKIWVSIFKAKNVPFFSISKDFVVGTQSAGELVPM